MLSYKSRTCSISENRRSPHEVLEKSLNFTQTLKHIILMGKRELVALLNLSSWYLVMVEWLFLAVPWGCLRFVIVVFPDHKNLLFLSV